MNRADRKSEIVINEWTSTDIASSEVRSLGILVEGRVKETFVRGTESPSKRIKHAEI